MISASIVISCVCMSGHASAGHLSCDITHLVCIFFFFQTGALPEAIAFLLVQVKEFRGVFNIVKRDEFETRDHSRRAVFGGDDLLRDAIQEELHIPPAVSCNNCATMHCFYLCSLQWFPLS